MRSVTVDGITFEMIRHKLHMVTAEALEALKNVSGTPSTSESLDVMVALYDRNGNLMLGGVGFSHHITSAAQAVKHLINQYCDDPGIEEDDAYLVNDPYTAALHAPDLYMISPIVAAGDLFGFVANFVHVTDIGAVDPGGFCPTARSSYEEGFQTPGLRLVKGGVLVRDVLDTLLNMVREPGMVQLDLRSQLAANHVAKNRIKELVREFGAEIVSQVADDLMNQSEERLKARLKEMPDGTWRTRQHVDAAGHLATVELTMTKREDSLTYDFTGSSPQLPIGINCTYWAAWGAMFAPLFPQLCWDLTWNDGITRPVRMIAPEGTIVNCTRPAPTSVATVGIVQVINNLSTVSLSKMLGASDRYHDRATAVWYGSHASVRVFGTTIESGYFLSSLTDTFAGAGGASAARDGIDLGGELPNVVSRWGNVERHESMAPMRYLYRRAVPDSGGPGRFRGGVSHEYAFTIDATNTEDDAFNVMLFGKGVRVPMSIGIFGGYPGCTVRYSTVREARTQQVASAPIEATEGEKTSWGTFILGASDAQIIRQGGGGGYGDPIDRDPEAVMADVLSGAVSVGAARDTYGVQLDAETRRVDRAGTADRRRQIRAERCGVNVAAIPKRTSTAVGGSRIGEYLRVAPSGETLCAWCGSSIAPKGERWKDRAQARRSKLGDDSAGSASENEGLELREFFCSTCGTLLDCEIALESDPVLNDDIVRWPKR